MTTKTKPSLIDDLLALDGKMLGRKCYRVLIGDDWLSGSPYPTTAFGERAYVFGSREDAERIAKRHFSGKKIRVVEYDA
jgi:hypothetical protein